MSTLQEFDYVLLDCPSLGLLTLNALTTATEVYIPLQTEFLALQGLSKLLQTVDIVKKRLNPTLTVTGLLGRGTITGKSSVKRSSKKSRATSGPSSSRP